MQWTVVSCVLSTLFLTSRADPVIVSSSPEDRSLHSDPAAVYNGDKIIKEIAMALLHGHMKQGGAVLKERLKESISNLKELLQEEDTHLNERISEGLARSKVQDDQLKEELVEDVAWLKEKLAKGLSYLKEELEEGEMKTNEELTKLNEAFEKRQHGVKQSGSAMMDDLRQQMTDFQAQLNSTKDQLQTTQTELNTHQETLQSTRADLVTTKESLQSTREQLHEEQQASTALKAQLEQEIRSLKVEMELTSSEMGSTFTRWGRTTCPDHTSLVYSGYVGGQRWDHSGGGSNYLCLVRDPQLDNMVLPAYYTYVYGAEYEEIDDQDDQDAVCSVCRAPQVTTLMIPATLSCPSGWTAQYRGHLVSDRYNHKGRTEFVCLDKVREHRDGEQGNHNDALFYHVVTVCGSLPCPPYVNNTVVTCVVCSM